MSAEDKTSLSIPKKVATIAVEGFIFRHGVEFVISGRENEPCFSKKLLDPVAHVVLTANLFLSYPIEQVHIMPSLISTELGHAEARAIASKDEAGLIELAKILFERALADKSPLALEVIAWHEAAHILHIQHPWLGIRASFYMMTRRLSNVFDVFDESTYIKFPGFLFGTGGHPDSNPDELFASTSTVLRYFPKKFMENVSELKPADKAIAVEAAKRVAIQYLEHPRCPRNFFDPVLLKFLGLETKKQPATVRN